MPLKPAEFETFIRAETESNAKLIKAAGITPN
jgi:tripartite-type tricarboxylate transporter receptor subunit TctC